MPVFEPHNDSQGVDEVPLCKLCSKSICRGGKVNVRQVCLSPDRIPDLVENYAAGKWLSRAVFGHPETVIRVYKRPLGETLFWLCLSCYEAQLAEAASILGMVWEPNKWEHFSVETL